MTSSSRSSGRGWRQGPCRCERGGPRNSPRGSIGRRSPSPQRRPRAPASCCPSSTESRSTRTRSSTPTTGGSGPPTDGASASFAFSSSEPGSTFECQLDSSAWTPSCSSPKSYSSLAGQGPHTFDVRATDAANNTDPTPASSSFTVAGDTQAQKTTINLRPRRQLPTQPLRSSPASTDMGMTRDRSPNPAPRHTAAPPRPRSPGRRRGVATRTSTTENSSRWPAVTAGQKYTFTAYVHPTVTRDFFIALLWRDGAKAHVDGSEGAHVTAPADQWTPISVTATAPAGTSFVLPVHNGISLDQNEVFYTDDWRLEQPTDGASASFAFSSSEPGFTFECQLDSSGWTPFCSSPKSYSSLAAGPHTSTSAPPTPPTTPTRRRPRAPSRSRATPRPPRRRSPPAPASTSNPTPRSSPASTDMGMTRDRSPNRPHRHTAAPPRPRSPGRRRGVATRTSTTETAAAGPRLRPGRSTPSPPTSTRPSPVTSSSRSSGGMAPRPMSM